MTNVWICVVGKYHLHKLCHILWWNKLWFELAFLVVWNFLPLSELYNKAFANSGGCTILRNDAIYFVQKKIHEHGLAAYVLLIIFCFLMFYSYLNFSWPFKGYTSLNFCGHACSCYLCILQIAKVGSVLVRLYMK